MISWVLFSPGSEVGKFAVINGLDDFANYGLLVEIMLLGLFQGFKIAAGDGGSQ